jgi:rubrerythrin
MKTDNNLKASFAGESSANKIYTAFARKAKQEDFPNIAKLFKAIADSELIHALNHLRASLKKGSPPNKSIVKRSILVRSRSKTPVEEVGSTIDNLRVAKKGNLFSFKKKYPEYIKDAEQENRVDAKLTFDYANKVKEKHEQLFQEAIEAVDSGKDLSTSKYFTCQTCGNTCKEIPDKCPICDSPKDQFKRSRAIRKFGKRY